MEGTTLLQVVEHRRDGVTYPVIADPNVDFEWWGVRIRFSKAETIRIAGGVGACAALVKPVPVVGAAVSLGCKLWTAVATGALARSKCLQINVRYIGATGGNPSYWDC